MELNTAPESSVNPNKSTNWTAGSDIVSFLGEGTPQNQYIGK